MAAVTGLDGIVVAETELSDVDGERGELVIRGYPVEDLVGRATFEDVWALLWTGRLPVGEERESWRVRLATARVDAAAQLPAIGNALDLADGMDALRAALGHLTVGRTLSGPPGGPEKARPTGVLASGDALSDAAMLTGAAAVFAAGWARRRAGQPIVPPDPSLSHAADYLRMILGEPAPSAQVDAVDAYLCCVVDHGLNASTLAARVVASTGSDMVSAAVAGVGALKGPLHGGAPGPVLDMLDAIGRPESARAWLEQRLAIGDRIMGMGHRIYRVRDPRAAALEQAATRLQRAGVGQARLSLAREVEREAEALLAERHPERRLRANVEFYTAVLLEAAGIPRALFSPTFAVSRIAGWCAHVDEQRRRGRLMRPQSKYIGPAPVR
jgi:citrate synthase